MNWRKIISFAVSIELGYLFLSTIKNTLNGSIPFWFDPARDLLLAKENLSKITLIGQPTGIPGLFYGPYWIWLLSIAELISKDPGIITLLVLTIPYLVVTTVIFYKLKNIFPSPIWQSLLCLFFISFSHYATQLWNPYPAPLLFLFLVFLISRSPKTLKQELINYFSLGVVAGFLLNFHMSFGIGIMAGLIFYTIFNTFLAKKLTFKKTIINLTLLIFGSILTFAPFFIFESRHGFNQIRVILRVLFNSAIKGTSPVALTGLSKNEIFQLFINSPGELLHLVPLVAIVLLLFGIFWIFKKRVSNKENERNLLLFSVISILSLMAIYMLSKNPVWTYHFIGLEAILLILVGIIVSKIKPLWLIFSIWTLILILNQVVNSVRNPFNILSQPTLAAKEHVLDIIYKDSAKEEFSIFIYSPAIYTYDYDYLIHWVSADKFHRSPRTDFQNVKYVYLIFPGGTKKEIKDDFANYHTSDKSYFTSNSWTEEDGSEIIKRIKTPIE